MKTLSNTLLRIIADVAPIEKDTKQINIRASSWKRASLVLKQVGFPSNASEILGAVYPMFEAYVAVQLSIGATPKDIIGQLRPVKTLIMSFSKQAQKKMGDK